MKKQILLFLPYLFFSACVKDKPATSLQTAVPLSVSKKVYTINEGAFPSGNASISFYDPGTGQVIQDIYATENNNAAVGDVAQDLAWINNSFYLVVNNSGKILVCDNQFKKTAQINNLSSPRYILQITNEKAYVSDYNANALSIVDLSNNLKTGSIPCAGWTEKMILIYNKVFVTNVRKNYVYVINTISDAIADSIYVGLNSQDIVLDKQDQIWVLSGGDQPNSVPAKLWRINSLTNQVKSSLAFGASDAPGNLCLNKTKDTLYYLNNGVCRLSITDTHLPAAPLVAAGSKNFYGLDINPNDYSIYAADALDYDQRANIYIYDAMGNQKSVFKAGINTNGFYFE